MSGSPLTPNHYKMNERIGLFIQSRLDSNRLPLKVRKEIYNGDNLLKIIYKSLKDYLPLYLSNTKVNNNAIVICFIIPDTEKEFASYLEKENIPYFVGSENNVLNRYIKTAEHFSLNKIIRLTGDNPFYDLRVLAKLIQDFSKSNADYMAIRGLLLGTAAEAFSVQALHKSIGEYSAQLQEEDKEHVSLFLKKNPDKFQLIFQDTFEISEEIKKQIRLTIDYPNDLDFIRSLCQKVKNIYNVSNKEILEIYSKHPNFFNKNNKNKQLKFF